MTTPAAIREKKRAALASVASALLLLTMKVYLSVATGSLGILSEALHSGLDLVATVVTYLSVRVADKPADARHTYGHAKVESFGAFVETGLLLLASLYIIYEAFRRLLFAEVHIEPSLLAVVILGLTMVVDVVRARALRRVARKHQSEALEADALHFSTDVWSTLVVMLGMTLVWSGERLNISWLHYADPLAALLVAGVVIWVGSRLGRRTLDALLDAAPAGVQSRIAAAVENMEGVLRVERVRVRRAGKHHFVDVTISAARTASFEQVHALSDAVEKRVAELLGGDEATDVVVHMEPRAAASENLFDAIRALALHRGLAIHELSAHQLNGKLYVDLHLEVADALTLREAHRRASELEDDILRADTSVAGVNIHIEPLGSAIPAGGEMKELAAAVQAHVSSLAREYDELVNCHEVRVRQVEHKIIVSCHCAMNGELPITQIHDVTEAIQDRVKEKFPQVFEVIIHPEPVEES
jgi:cation diffusion facilitator family transporter